MVQIPHIPGYEFLRPLGSGTFTEVFAARRLRDDRICAIKQPRDGWAIHDSAVRLLRQEHHVLSEVRHPNLSRLLDAEFTEEFNYIALEYLEGETLRDRLQHEFSLDLRASIWIGRQIAEALSALHRAGLTHGDIKPENIFLRKTGPAILIDLGFAERFDAPDSEIGLILGTANYRAPEASCDPYHVSSKSDWYSFGVTLFESMTGVLPRDLDVAKIQIRWPLRLSALFNRLLSSNPSARPADSFIVHELIALEIAALNHRRAA